MPFSFIDEMGLQEEFLEYLKKINHDEAQECGYQDAHDNTISDAYIKSILKDSYLEGRNIALKEIEIFNERKNKETA